MIPRTPAHAVLHVLLFCSGASGLIYEIVWVREFGNIFGNTVYSAGALSEASRLVRPATDDRPIQEYAARSRFSPGKAGAPLSIFRVDGVSDWCPKCFAGVRPIPPVEGLDVYLAILDSVYRDPAFRERGLRLPEGPGAREAIARSPYLRGLIERAREVASKRSPR